MHSSIKTIAGFANAAGGTLLIGVDDDEEITGLELDDYSGNHDEYYRKIGDKVNASLSTLAGNLLNMKIVKMDNAKEVCVVTVQKSDVPIFCRDKKIKDDYEWFFVRQMAKTKILKPSEVMDYINNNFKK